MRSDEKYFEDELKPMPDLKVKYVHDHVMRHLALKTGINEHKSPPIDGAATRDKQM